MTSQSRHLLQILGEVRPKRIVVVGDLMLDRYTFGKVGRISPEAPVPVLQVEREEWRPGGAGNAALNLRALGQHVVLLGRVGPDAMGETLRSRLVKEGIDLKGVLPQADYPTPVKNRLIAANQQMIRVDHEEICSVSTDIADRLTAMLPNLLADVDLVAISDYGKGFLSDDLLHALIAEARKRNIPVIADPKGKDLSRYRGATLLKPNLQEAIAGTSLGPTANLQLVADELLSVAGVDYLLITRSEKGISLFSSGERHDIPSKVREVRDVTGAGDTVLAVLAAAMANRVNIKDAARLANEAGGLAVQHFGCARISLSELARSVLTVSHGEKILSTSTHGESTLPLPEMTLQHNQFMVLRLTGTEGLTPKMVQVIQQLKQEYHEDLVVYVNDNRPDREFLSLLASLDEIDFVTASSQRVTDLCRSLTPARVYALDQELVSLDQVEQLLDRKVTTTA